MYRITVTLVKPRQVGFDTHSFEGETEERAVELGKAFADSVQRERSEIQINFHLEIMMEDGSYMLTCPSAYSLHILGETK